MFFEGSVFSCMHITAYIYICVCVNIYIYVYIHARRRKCLFSNFEVLPGWGMNMNDGHQFLLGHGQGEAPPFW